MTSITNVMTDIVVDLRANSTLYGDDVTRFIATYVCIKLKRQPEYLSTQEQKYIEKILGEDFLTLAERYIEQSSNPHACSSDVSNFFYGKLVYPFKLSLEKCEYLKKLILESPLVILREDEDSHSAEDSIAAAYGITISSYESQITTLSDEKISAIYARTKGAKIAVAAISRIGWDALQKTISNYTPQPQITYLYNNGVRNYHTISSNVSKQNDCCCNII